GMDTLLGDLGFDPARKREVAAESRAGYAREFGIGGGALRQLGERFRKERGSLESLLGAAPDGEHPLAPGVTILRRRSEQLAPVAEQLREAERTGRLSVPLTELARSYLH